jgi:hypothetical protein
VTTDDGIHATHNLADINWQERKCGKGRAVRATGIAKETGETLEKQGVLNIRRRRVTFILDCFPVSGEGE